MHQDIIQLLQISDVEIRLNIIQTLPLPSLVDGLLEQKNKRSVILSIAQHAPSMAALFSKQEEKDSVQSLSPINKLFENLAEDGDEVVCSTLYGLMNIHSHAPWMARLIELIQSETLLKALCWKGNWSTLIFNAFRENRPLCKAFIEKLDAKTLGKICQQADQQRNTPLHLLFRHQDETNCILLLKKLELKEQELKEFISQICDENTLTPLHIAFQYQNGVVLRYLFNFAISPWWIYQMSSLGAFLGKNQHSEISFAIGLRIECDNLTSPKEKLQKHPAEFLAFIRRYVNTKKILDAHRWVELIKTVLNDYEPGDDVEKRKIREALLLLLSEVYLYLEYHSAGEEKHPVDYRINMRGVYFSLKQPGQLTAEQNLRIGEELTVMLGTPYWQALEAKNVEELKLPGDARLWISLAYAPDCHNALYQGLQHLLQAIRQTAGGRGADEETGTAEEQSILMIKESVKSLFLNYLQVDEDKSSHQLLDTWLEDEKKQDSLIPQKLAQIKQRSEQLEQWQWHEFSRELKKSLKQPHTAEERAFFLILLPLKFKFEIVASSSYKEAHQVLDALLTNLSEEISSLHEHSTYSMGLEQIENSLHTIKEQVPLPDLPREEKVIEHPENNTQDFFPSEIKIVEMESYREEEVKKSPEETLSIPLLTYSIFATDDEEEKFTQSRETEINAVHDGIKYLQRQSRLELSEKILLKIAEKIIELDTHSRSCLRASRSQTTLRHKCDLLLELYFKFKYLITSQLSSPCATEVITCLNRLQKTEIKIFCYWFGTSSFSLSPCSLFAKKRQTSTMILINQVYEYTKPLTRQQDWELSIGS